MNLYRMALITSVLAFSATARADNLYRYELTSYPANSTGCAATAASLGQRFSATTGKSVYQAACVQQTRLGYDISLTYRSLDELPLVSTSKEDGGFGYLGIYRSMEDCARNLSQEVTWFRDATGLEPFLSYCFKESDINETPYAARIDAFGSASLHPYRFDALVFGALLDGTDVLDEILSAARSEGINATMTTVAHDGSENLVVRYFDPPENSLARLYYFSAKEFGKFYSYDTVATKNACRAELEDAKAGFATEFTTPSVWFCVWDQMLFTARLYAVRVKPERDRLFFELAPNRYETYADCHSDRDRVLEYYRRDLGKDAYAGVCSWDSTLGDGLPDAYQLQIYVRNVQ